MQDEKTILRKAREAIDSGRLPNRRPDRMLGGTGFGASCAVCGEPVTPDQAEFELEFASADGHRKGNADENANDSGNGNGAGHSHTRHVHIRCFAAWEFERHAKPAEACDNPTMSLPALDVDGTMRRDGSKTAIRRGPAK